MKFKRCCLFFIKLKINWIYINHDYIDFGRIALPLYLWLISWSLNLVAASLVCPWPLAFCLMNDCMFLMVLASAAGLGTERWRPWLGGGLTDGSSVLLWRGGSSWRTVPLGDTLFSNMRPLAPLTFSSPRVCGGFRAPGPIFACCCQLSIGSSFLCSV